MNENRILFANGQVFDGTGSPAGARPTSWSGATASRACVLAARDDEPGAG